jgi:hypothetical protein
MPRDKFNIALIILVGLVVVAGAATVAYRYYFYGDADPIAKFLCEDFGVANGAYDRCMKHYKQ